MAVASRKTQRMSDALLTVKEVLTELQVARSTFDTWRALGTAPPCSKLPNGEIRVRRSDLDAWLAARIEYRALIVIGALMIWLRCSAGHA